jgi:hypothetical protein
MAKSNRRRKLDRAKRQARDSQKRVTAQRRQAAEGLFTEAITAYVRMFDPDVTASELAGLISERYDGSPISLFLVGQLTATGSSPERLAEISAAMLAADGAGPSLTALTFAAEVARAAGDSGRGRELLDQALTAAGDSYERVHLTKHLQASGRLADAILLLEARLGDQPDDDYVVELYGVAMQDAYEHAHLEPALDDCPCGQGSRWSRCCGPREQAALDRFADRTGLNALTEAIGEFLARSPFGQAVDDQVADTFEAYEDLEWPPAERASFLALITEHALRTASCQAPGAADEDEDDEDETLLPLGAFAVDPSVPAEVAARAEIWRTQIHYGLWRIDSRSGAPGLWCTDICTGVVRYAEFPPHLPGPWPRWSVWLGALVPVDGVWRATGAGLRLSPAEADAAAEFLQDAVASLVYGLAGKKKRPSRRPTEPMRFGLAEPHGVVVDYQDPVDRDLAAVTGMVVGSLLSRIIGEVQVYRSSAPALRNSDGDDFAWPGGVHARPRGAASGEGWEKPWLDEQLPALRGRTPRQAASGKERSLLEALLRQYEYENDLLAAQGQVGVDTDWMRQELDMLDEAD